jgi:hypothetical protein
MRAGHKAVDNYRHFIIATSLSSHSFKGSYSLKVYLSTKEGEVPIGSVSVLGRGNSSSCGNCQAQRSAGTRVRGVITIPHSAVIKLLENHGINNSDAKDHEVVDAFKTNLIHRLVLPSGTVHSEASGNNKASDNPILAEEPFPSLRLLSCNVSHHDLGNSDEPKTPFEFYDWKDHESLITGAGQWTKK